MNNKTIVSINECDYGSTGTIAKSVLNFCSNYGYDTCFVTFESLNKPNCETLITSKNFLYDNFTRLLCRIDGSDGFHNKISTKRIINSLEKKNVLLIHLHNVHGRYLNLPLLFEYARQKNIQIVWTLHDCWAFTGRCPHFESANCFRWKEKCGKCPTKKEYPSAYIFDCSSRYLKKKTLLFKKYSDLLSVVCPSKWLINYLNESKINFLKNYLIYNGIDRPTITEFAKIEELKKSLKLENKIVFLSVAAGFEKRKGFSFINQLADEMEQSRYAFVVIGLPKLKKETVSKNIIDIGYIHDRNTMNLYFEISDALLNPTLEDNFPTVNLEALSHGKPVITFNTGGSPESIDSNSGVVVEKGNYLKLKKAVEFFDHNQFSKDDCLARFEEFTSDKMCRKYLELFTKLTEVKK